DRGPLHHAVRFVVLVLAVVVAIAAVLRMLVPRPRVAVLDDGPLLPAAAAGGRSREHDPRRLARRRDVEVGPADVDVAGRNALAVDEANAVPIAIVVPAVIAVAVPVPPAVAALSAAAIVARIAQHDRPARNVDGDPR